MYSLRALLGSQNHSGMVPVAGLLLMTKDRGFLGRAVWEDEKDMLSFLWESIQTAWSSLWNGWGVNLEFMSCIKEKTGKGDIVVGVLCKPSDQEEQMSETLYRLRRAASLSQVLVLMGCSTAPNIFCGKNKAMHKQSRRILKCINKNFQTQ